VAWAKQSVIVRKTHPKAKTRVGATRVARRYADRIYTSRETRSSWRFRQRPPGCFRVMKTKSLSSHVLLVLGLLKKGARARRACR